MSKQDKIHGFAGGTGASLKVWLGQTQSDNYIESRWKLDQRLCSLQLSLTLSLLWPPTRSFDRLQTWVTAKPPYKHQPLRSQTALTMTSCEYPPAGTPGWESAEVCLPSTCWIQISYVPDWGLQWTFRRSEGCRWRGQCSGHLSFLQAKKKKESQTWSLQHMSVKPAVWKVLQVSERAELFS